MYFGLGALSTETVIDDPLRRHGPIIYALVTGSGRKKTFVDRVEIQNAIMEGKKHLISKGYQINVRYEDEEYICVRRMDGIFKASFIREPETFGNEIVSAAVDFTRDVIATVQRIIPVPGR